MVIIIKRSHVCADNSEFRRERTEEVVGMNRSRHLNFTQRDGGISLSMVRTKLWGRDIQNTHPEEENDQLGRAHGFIRGLNGTHSLGPGC